MKPSPFILLLLTAACQPGTDAVVFGPGILEITDPVTATDLECSLSSPRTTYKLGERVELQVRIRNLSQQTVTLIGALDASDNQWRYPHCTFERRSSEDVWQPVTSGARCGNTNDLRLADLVRVQPGEAFDPYAIIDGGGFFETRVHTAEYWSTPGEYRLRFHYSTLADSDSDFRGDLNMGRELQPEVRHDLERVPRVELWSNELVIRIEP